MSKMDVVDFAHQIIAMQDTIDEQRRQIAKLVWYEEKYHELLDSSLEHNAAMAGNLMKLAFTPGVIEACAAASVARNHSTDPKVSE